MLIGAAFALRFAEGITVRKLRDVVVWDWVREREFSI
jgi:hypothetical protein